MVSRLLTMLCIALTIFVPFFRVSAHQIEINKFDTGMTVYVYRPDVLETGCSIESIAYNLLLKKPLDAKINYVAIPWSSLLNDSKESASMIDKIKVAFQGIHIDNGFTICYRWGCHFLQKKLVDVLKKIGIDCIFTPRATRQELIVDGICIEPFPYYSMNSCEPDFNKDILYSFIGNRRTHKIRDLIFTIKHPSNTVVIDRGEPVLHLQDAGLRIALIEEYKDVLSRSRFSLCPRGVYANSIRFYESLQAGAIPILISDAARLPDGFDWDRCIIHVKESEIHLIPNIIMKITPKKEETMRQACLEAYALFSGDLFVSVIRNYYEG